MVDISIATLEKHGDHRGNARGEGNLAGQRDVAYEFAPEYF
jgi:hypothetical protein